MHAISLTEKFGLFEPQDIHHTGGVDSDRTVAKCDHI